MFAVCITTGEIFGGISWGFDSFADLTPRWATKWDVVRQPSADWNDAVSAWNTFAKKQGYHQFPDKSK